MNINTFSHINSDFWEALLRRISIITLSTIILIPKIGAGFLAANLLVFFLIFLALIIMPIPEISLKFDWEYLYVGLIYFSLLSIVICSSYLDHFDHSSFFRVLKFGSFIAYVHLGFYLGKRGHGKQLTHAIFKWSVLAIFLNALFVLYHLKMHPISASAEVWSYSFKYRIVGLVSYRLDSGGLELVAPSGHVGVYLALICCLALAFFMNTGRRIYLFLFFLLSLCVFYSHSRSGLITLITGTTFGAVVLFRKQVTVKTVKNIAFIPTISILFFVFFPEIIEHLIQRFSSLGVMKKILIAKSGILDGSARGRIEIWLQALNDLIESPKNLVFGFGSSKDYLQDYFGRSQFEGLFADTLMQSGIIGFFLILFLFMLLFRNIFLIFLNSRGYLRSVSLALLLFFPGYLISNLIGANTLHAEFLAPVVFFFVGLINGEKNLRKKTS